MSTTPEAWMQVALDLADQGRGEVEPNPRVGAVAVQDGQIVGRGWHAYYTGNHAEVAALEDARARGAHPDTLVCTMEPCSTPVGVEGKKTPACTQAIVSAGIRQVIFGMADPDPRHRGKAASLLEASGVQVRDGLLATRAREQNAAFRKALSLDRPWTIAKWAMTLDGKTATPSGDARWISGSAAQREVHQLRARVDAVVVGFRTARMDDPELTVRHVEGPQPVRIVVDPFAELDDDSRLVASAHKIPTWILCGPDADAQRTGHLTDLGVQVIHVRAAESSRRLQLREAWRELRRRGLRRILVEGGGGLLAQLLAWDCVDQLRCYVAPKLIGGQFAPTPLAGVGHAFMAQALPVREFSHRNCAGDLVLEGFLLPETDS